MAGENLETVRRLYEEFDRREDSLAFEVLEPEIEWDARGSPIFDLDRVFHGHDGVREFWRGWLQAWDEIDFRVDEAWESGDHVVAVISQRQRGRDSAIWTEFGRYVHIFTFREGRVVRVRYEQSPENARRDLPPD